MDEWMATEKEHAKERQWAVKKMNKTASEAAWLSTKFKHELQQNYSNLYALSSWEQVC